MSAEDASEEDASEGTISEGASAESEACSGRSRGGPNKPSENRGPTDSRRTEARCRDFERQTLGADFVGPEVTAATGWAQRSRSSSSSSSSSSAGGWGSLGLSEAAELEIPCIRSQSFIVITTSRAWLPLYWPTMPSSAM